MRPMLTTTHKCFHKLYFIELPITITISDDVNSSPHHFPLTYRDKQSVLEPQQSMSPTYFKIERLNFGSLVTIDGDVVN